MRVAPATVAWMLCVGCADRSVGNESGTTSTTTSQPEAGSSDPETSEAPTPDTASAEATAGSSGDVPVMYPDCRIFFPGYPEPPEGPPENCSQGYGATITDAWVAFACGNCVCVEFCEQDGDCIDRGAPVPPRCLPLANPESSACFLVCEDDQDCPTDMVCLPSDHLSEKACYLPWLKPECCEQGGPTC
jgi:hypothetical protein